MRLISLVSLIFILLKLSVPAEGKVKDNKFIISSRVKVSRGNSDSIKVTVFNLSDNCNEVHFINGRKGKVIIELQYNKNYLLDFEKEGFFKKRLDVSTHVPGEVFSKDPFFKPLKFDIILYPSIPEYYPDFSKEPIAKIRYSNTVDDFDAVSNFDDKMIVRQIKVAKAESIERAYDGHVAKAQKLEHENKLKESLREYMIALNIRPREAFIRGKIKELNRELQREEAIKGIKNDFERFMQQGDLMYERGEYSDALSSYLKALRIRPGNAKARLKKLKTETAIKEVEKAKTLNVKEKEAEFKAIIKKADSYLKAGQFEQADHLYHNALLLQPGNTYVAGRIYEISRKLNEIAIREKTFEEVLSVADSHFVAGNFSRGLSYYYQARELQPGNDYVDIQIAETKKMISDIAEDQKRYESALAEADSLMEQQHYDLTVVSLKVALEIDPGSAYAKNKIAEAVEKHCEKEVIRKIAWEFTLFADSNFISGNYEEAAEYYTKALKMQPEDENIARKLYESEEKLKVLLVDEEYASKKAAEERQFVNFMKQGEIAWDYECYTEAFSDFEKAFNIKKEKRARERYEDAMDKVSKLKGTENIFDDNLSENADILILYNKCIAKADKEFGNSEWRIARFYYMEAEKYDPEIPYPQLRARECDKMIKANITNELQKRYQILIENGDSTMLIGQLSYARINYAKALTIKAWKKYPADKLIEIGEKIKALRVEKKREQYMKHVKNADIAFENRNYLLAKYFYHKAESYNADSYPKEKLAEIDSILVTAKR